MEESKFLIITGMSGAGKTQVVRTLEDMNFFCIDNLPPALILSLPNYVVKRRPVILLW